VLHQILIALSTEIDSANDDDDGDDDDDDDGERGDVGEDRYSYCFVGSRCRFDSSLLQLTHAPVPIFPWLY